MKEFCINFTGCCLLSESEIWPDGDAPKNPTVHDLIDKIKSSGSKFSFIEDWNLDSDLGIRVSDDKETKYWY